MSFIRPGSITWLVTVVYQVGWFGVVIVVVARALVAGAAGGRLVGPGTAHRHGRVRFAAGFGDHLRLPNPIMVSTLAAIIGGVAPSPSGMGVVEAGLILGLTAAGVAEADATAAVFIQRLFTSCLPPIWG